MFYQEALVRIVRFLLMFVISDFHPECFRISVKPRLHLKSLLYEYLHSPVREEKMVRYGKTNQFYIGQSLEQDIYILLKTELTLMLFGS